VKVQRNIRLAANDPTVLQHQQKVKQFARSWFDQAPIIERNCRGAREYNICSLLIRDSPFDRIGVAAIPGGVEHIRDIEILS
jgi:hypothetical protein